MDAVSIQQDSQTQYARIDCTILRPRVNDYVFIYIEHSYHMPVKSQHRSVMKSIVTYNTAQVYTRDRKHWKHQCSNHTITSATQESAVMT